ncbi:MAG TPA: DNA alkylation repair protein [Planctomycetota bacterium]|jgi:3-methyladenine DNA glycosylase AlkD|nr:DNA alkylation repair protein [Planctomycetota bacterium]
MAPTKTTTTRAKQPAKSPAARMTFDEAMSALETAGSAQTRKTYARHGAAEPMFGVSFAVLKALVKRIGVDHELARALWATENFDARNLAVKVADPARMSSAELDRWAEAPSARMVCAYVAQLAAEGPHARTKADSWLASTNEAHRRVAWSLVGAMAMRDEATPDAWFLERLAEIEEAIHESPNAQREAMIQAVVAIGCRSAPLRKAATAAAKRIGKVEVDHGDTACKTPDAVEYIAKSWAHSTSKGFASPAAHERTRESPRTRC